MGNAKAVFVITVLFTIILFTPLSSANTFEIELTETAQNLIEPIKQYPIVVSLTQTAQNLIEPIKQYPIVVSLTQTAQNLIEPTRIIPIFITLTQQIQATPSPTKILPKWVIITQKIGETAEKSKVAPIWQEIINGVVEAIEGQYQQVAFPTTSPAPYPTASVTTSTATVPTFTNTNIVERINPLSLDEKTFIFINIFAIIGGFGIGFLFGKSLVAALSTALAAATLLFLMGCTYVYVPIVLGVTLVALVAFGGR